MSRKPVIFFMASNNFDLLEDPKQSKLNRQNIKSLK